MNNSAIEVDDDEVLEEEAPYYNEYGYSEEEERGLDKDCVEYAVSDDGHVRLQIIVDTNCYNPREDYDHMGHMIFWNSRYGDGYGYLSDKGEDKYPNAEAFFIDRAYDIVGREKLIIDEEDIEEMELDDIINLVSCYYEWIPINLYEHSYIIIRESNDPIDCFGLVYMSHDEIIKEYGDCDSESIAKAYSYMRSEIEEYDAWLRGDVYGFVLEKDGEEIHGCWGLIGSNCCKEEARGQLSDEYKYLVDKLSWRCWR